MSADTLTVRLADGEPLRARVDLLTVAVTTEMLRGGGLRALRRATGPRLRAELAWRRFTGAEGAAVLLAGGGGLAAPHLLVVGLGAQAALKPDVWRKVADQVVARGREVRARTAALALAPSSEDVAGTVEVLAESAVLASYVFAEYRKRDPERVAMRTLLIFGAGAARERRLAAALRRATTLARATNEARTWINTPAGVLTPAVFAAEAERVGSESGLGVEIDDRAGITKLGMGALLAVARGSAEEPRFIRLTYRPPVPARRRLALVGKGITFDSGGLSLKTSDGMEHMKRDMAGGAAVIGAMRAIAALRPPVEVRAYVPASENMPGGSAMKPGDVLRTASGKTIEVLNTDAEGRLVLADALSIALRDAPDAIVDIATLTGAVRTALGTRVGAVLGNDAALVRTIIDAGAASGERLWQLPLVAAYRSDIDSTVADMRNVAADGYGGTIHAALLLQEFTGGRPWAHLDIAGVAFTERDLPCTPRGAVGFGVRLLTRWVLAMADAPLSAVAPAVPAGAPLVARADVPGAKPTRTLAETGDRGVSRAARPRGRRRASARPRKAPADLPM